MFWPAVRDHLESGSTLADEATGQEQAAKQVLASLDKLSPDDADFEQLLARFIVDAREHIEFEESQVWPLMRTARRPCRIGGSRGVSAAWRRVGRRVT